MLTNVRLYIFVIMLKEKKVSRKKQILHKATELFKEKGYAASSMRDLANALEIEAASLYSHIKSKEEILQTICFRMAGEFFETLDDFDLEGCSASEKLEKMMVAHLFVITKDTAASTVFFHEWRHLSDPYLQDFLQMRDAYEGRFSQVLLEGMENGEFKKMDVKFTVWTLLSSLNWTHQWYKPTGKMTPEEIGTQLSQVLINGLAKK